MRKFWSSMIAGIAFACAVSINACSSDNPIELGASTATGTWNAVGEVVGSADQWILTVSGSTVQGTGNWSREACCSGTAAIVGTVRGDSLQLDVTYLQTQPTPGSAPQHALYDAALTSPTDLAVRVHGASGTPLHFLKQTP